MSCVYSFPSALSRCMETTGHALRQGILVGLQNPVNTVDASVSHIPHKKLENRDQRHAGSH